MGGAFKRSWAITKLCVHIINKDKELLLFPLMGGIFSLLFMAVLLFPTIINNLITSGQFTHSIQNYVLLFITYFGLAFIATFFNVCVVFTVKRRLEDKCATFGQGITFALSRLNQIFMWSLISATIGVLLHMLHQATRRMRGIQRIMFTIIHRLLGATWGIVTIFVVPGMVYHNLRPMSAIKRSAMTLRKTWGESLIRHYGVGLVQLLVLFVFFIGAIALIVLGSYLGVVGLIVTISIAVIVFIGIILFFNVVHTVFNTALYVYADNGKIAPGYSEEILSHAFRSKKKRVPL